MNVSASYHSYKFRISKKKTLFLSMLHSPDWSHYSICWFLRLPGPIPLSKRQIFPLRFNASILPHKHPIKARRLQGKARMLNVVAASRKPLPCDSLRPSCLTGKFTLSQRLTKLCKPYPTYSTGARVKNGSLPPCAITSTFACPGDRPRRNRGSE